MAKKTILLILSAIFMISGTDIFSQKHNYVPEILINAHWGTATGEFGLRDGKEIEPVGPITFTLDNKNNIYILDTINGRIQKFDKDGKLLAIIGRKIYGSTMCVDNDGNLYLLQRNFIRQYSPTGELKKIFFISEDINLIDGHGQLVLFDESGSLSISTIEQKIYKIAIPNQKLNKNIMFGNHLKLLSKFEQVQSEKLGIPGNNSKTRFITRWQNKHKALVSILKNEGTFIRDIPLVTTDILGSVIFLKQDNKSSIYVEVERITQDNYVHLEVMKYKVEGSLLATVELPNDYYTTCYKKVEVDNLGNIYQMLTTEEGVQLIKWYLR